MTTLNKQSCPTCGRSANVREINLFAGMVQALWKVVKWCREKHQWEFKRRDIKHLFSNENEIARFGDWILFGGLVYRPVNHKGKTKKGTYGINLIRAEQFFRGELQIPLTILKDPLIQGENSLQKTNYGTIHDVKSLKEFLDKDNEFIARYHQRPVEERPIQTLWNQN